MTAHAFDKIDLKSREYFDRRLNAMRLERETFIPHYKDISEFLQPRRGRYFVTDVNRGENRYKSIINSTATQAARTARNGFFSGTMSPSRPWFRQVVADPDLMEFPRVKEHLELREKIVRAIFNQGNLYSMAPVMLGELLNFGTGCMTHVDDFKDVARFYTHTIGSYMIAQDDRFDVQTVAREFLRTTLQLVAQFGLDSVTVRVRNSWDRGDYDKQFEVVHFIEPNPDARDGGVFSIQKPFRSVYYEKGLDDKKFLGFSGFNEFPAYCPRWEVTGEDIYGTDCPGMTVLGDVKGLQTEEKRKAQGIDKIVNPPLHGPASLANVPASSLPGGLTTYDAQGTHVLRSIYDVRLSIGEIMADIEKVERRIEQAFFADLFNAISNMQGIQPRNQEELLQRNEERLLQLGPVLERVHGEFLARMVERTDAQAERAGIMPPLPQELVDSKVEVRFISSLALAQKAVATGSIERLVGFTAQAAAAWPQVLDKVDIDQAVDEFGDAIGAPARLIVPDDEVQKKREADAQKAAEAQAIEAVKSIGPTAIGAGQLALDDSQVAPVE